MKAVIVAGGKGERLTPLTNTIPKPMIEVDGKPILEHIVRQMKQSGIKDFIFCLCYLPEVITSYFGDGLSMGINIQYVYEEQIRPLGTAGAVKLAEQYIDDTFLVTYADILRIIDIKDFISVHKKRKGTATLAVYKNSNSNPKSLIRFDNKNRIQTFIERPDILDEVVW
jgi:NDP-sugar pyrophosphorylase family protein